MQSLRRLCELSSIRIFVFVLMKLNADGVTTNSVLCTEETNDIQVISEGELRRDSLGLSPAPDQEQGVEADRHAGGRDVGDAGSLGLTPQAPAALGVSQGNQNVEDLERDQLVIRDGQEEEQDADKQGGREALGAAFPYSPS